MNMRLSSHDLLCLGKNLSIIIILGTSIISCSTSMKQPKGITSTQISHKTQLKYVQRVVVMDFREQLVQAPQTRLNKCPITGIHFIRGKVPGGSGAIVAGQFREALRREKFNVIYIGDMERTIDKLPENIRANYSVEFGVALGKAMGADIVIMGSVMRYEERVGGSWAAETPAKIGFSTAIIEISKSKIFWQAKFEKTQESLLSNLLDFQTFFKGGMVWQKAEVLSSIGVSSTLEMAPIRPAKQ